MVRKKKKTWNVSNAITLTLAGRPTEFKQIEIWATRKDGGTRD